MNNKKGFTLVEVLAVIVLLGILASVAVVGVSKYRKDVDDREIVALRQSIKSAFNTYRIKNDVSEKYAIEDFSVLSFEGGLKYSGEKCNNPKGKVLYVVNGTYFSKFEDNEEDMIKYKVCELFRKDDDTGKKQTVCIRDDKNNYVPSNMETVCVKLSCDGNVVINDFEDTDSICQFTLR